jgi:hypothetical protein
MKTIRDRIILLRKKALTKNVEPIAVSFNPEDAMLFNTYVEETHSCGAAGLKKVYGMDIELKWAGPLEIVCKTEGTISIMEDLK